MCGLSLDKIFTKDIHLGIWWSPEKVRPQSRSLRHFLSYPIRTNPLEKGVFAELVRKSSLFSNFATDSATSLPPGIRTKIPFLIDRDCARHAAVTPMLRGSIFYLRWNVPKRYAGVEPRREVWITLKTDSQTEARRRALGIKPSCAGRRCSRALTVTIPRATTRQRKWRGRTALLAIGLWCARTR